MRKRRDVSLSDSIGEYFRKMGPSTASACADALGENPTTVHARIFKLVQKGGLKRAIRLGHSIIYEYVDGSEAYGRPAEIQVKLWRAIRLSKRFTLWEVALLSGASLAYAKGYVAHLADKGLVTRAGRDGRKVIFCCAPHAPVDTPRMIKGHSKREVHLQEIITLGWEVMRSLRDGETEEAKEKLKVMSEELGVEELRS